MSMKTGKTVLGYSELDYNRTAPEPAKQERVRIDY